MPDSRSEIAQQSYLLEEAESLFRDTFEQSAVGMAHVGLDTRLLRVNQALCDFLGYTREELLGYKLLDITAPEDVEESLRFHAEIRGSNRRSLDLEKRYLHKDGSIVWARVNSTLVKDERGASKYFMCVFLNITEQKRSWAALESSEERLSTVFLTSPDAILVTRNSDGVYVDVNEGFAAIAGWARDEIVGRRVSEVDPWNDSAVRNDFMARIRRDGEVRGFEAVFRRKDGTVVETLVSARLIQFDGEECTLSVATDVSALKSAERRVLALNRIYTILSGVNQALVRLREPQAILEEACRVIVEEGGFRMAWVGLLEPDGIHVRVAAHAGVDDGYLENPGIVLGDDRLGRGPTGVAVSEGHHLVSQDIEIDPAMAPWRDSALARGYRASAAFPLIVNDRAVGAFTMYADEPNAFDAEQVALLDELASDISFSLDFAEREESRRKTEASLRESEGWLSESQRTARLGHYVYDIEKDWWDGSPTLYEVLGVDEGYRRDFEGWLATVHPDDREQMSLYFTGEVLGKHQPFDMDYRVSLPSDGAERWVHGTGHVEFHRDGHPIAMFGTIQDITERKRAEEQHESILQTAMDGYWLSGPEGRLLEVNEAYCRMSGYTKAELLTMSVSDLEVFERAEDVADHAERIIAQGHDRFETRHRRKDGSMFEVESSVRYLRDSAQFAAFQRDITARKRRDAYGVMRRKILESLNERGDWSDSLEQIARTIRAAAGVDAVGIRLRDGDDFPYIAHVGMPEGLLETENSLIARDADGEALRDSEGKAVLECTCGLVLSGTDDALLTSGGSFWTNDSITLLSLPADQDPRRHPRNVCVLEGFASVALVPIMDDRRVVGLIHLNGRRKGCFDLETMEQLEGIAAHIGEGLTRRRDAEDLRRSERRYRMIADNATDVVWILNPQTSRFVYVSPSIERQLGFTPAEVLDRQMEDLLTSESAAVARETLTNAVADFLAGRAPEGQAYEVQAEQVCEDGSTLWTEIVASLVVNGETGVLEVHGVTRDITDRRHAEEQLAKALSSITDVVGRIAEMRDPYTAGHQRRVAELAVAIAEQMQMPDEEIEEIRVAALIHDIGKMSVPAEILSKPGALLPVEFEIIKGHAEAGYQILTASDMQGSSPEIVFQHHERCDGSGYPRGLSAEELLPQAKVLMVADVVEAMTSHRPYRPGLGVNAALAEIERGAGGLYDSDVSEACAKVFAERGFAFTEV